MCFFKSWLKKKRRSSFSTNQQVSKNCQGKRILEMASNKITSNNSNKCVREKERDLELLKILRIEMTLTRMTWAKLTSSKTKQIRIS